MHEAAHPRGEGSFQQEVEELPTELPVFPLPGVVLFPCTLLPLHVFEQRYRRMVRDLLEQPGCATLGIAKLKPGWEAAYYGSPAVHDVICVARLLKVVPYRDGRFDIAVCGARRARVLGYRSETPYRIARVALLEERPLSGREQEAARLRDQLLARLARLPAMALRHENLPLALEKLDPPLGCAADLVADSLLVPARAKQVLLEELDPFIRAQKLIALIEAELSLSFGRRDSLLVHPSLN